MRISRHRLLIWALLAPILVLAAARGSRAAPDPLTCEGYPERRVFLESQSWWSDERQPSPGAHIHVGTCFPLFQEIRGVVTLDVRLVLHGDPGETNWLRIQVRETDASGSSTNAMEPVQIPLEWRCPLGQTCERWESVQVDTTQAAVDGRKEFRITLNVPSTPEGPNAGNRQFQTTRWHAILANGDRPVRDYEDHDRTGAAGWYTVSEYTNARLRDQYAVQAAEQTLCGIWSPQVLGEKDHLVVSIDSANHGMDPGIIVYDGLADGAWRSVDIDTSTLSQGTHRLFLRADDTMPNGTSSGVFVIPFRVGTTGIASETSCSDGLDEDCDGQNDCSDPDCSDDPACVCDGDGICEAGEDCIGCPSDCRSGTCGNGRCDAANGEDCVSCPSDCNGKQGGSPSGRFCCGAGGGKNPVPCSDERCTSFGFACSNLPTLATCCGDSSCEEGEDRLSCSVDCGDPPSCGDELCEFGESACRCAVDCGTPPLVEEICTNGLDEDCDNQVDCFDPDCSGHAACSCLPRDAACTNGAECCSGKCKGGVCRGG
jgi:hypothetical protein